MHLDDETLQRLLHDELSPATGAAMRRHVTECGDCRMRVDDATQEEVRLFERLRAIDQAPPLVTISAIAARARRSRPRWHRRVAAMIAALATAGVAYAAPGSPLPLLLRRTLGQVADAPRAAAPARVPRALESTGGIIATPGDRFTIAFRTGQPSGTATVRLSDGEAVVVRALGGSASFASDVDRLSIDNPTGDPVFEIEIPRSARWVEIRVGDRRVLLKSASAVQTDARQDAEGRYVIRLTR